MASTIDRNIPVAGTDVDAPEIQGNFVAAANDIDALQGRADSLESTAPTSDQKAALDGSATPATAANPYVTEADAGAGIHNDLSGRDAADAHPTAAVTGLDTALAGKMDTSVYDTTGDGVVNAAEAVAFVLTNATGSPLAVGELVQFDSGGNIIGKANASTSTWAQAMTAEAIGNGAQGRVVTFGLVGGIDTTGFAERDIVYTGDAGALSPVPVRDSDGSAQVMGVVLQVGVTGFIEVSSEAPEKEPPDGGIGTLSLTDAAAPFTHNQSIGWQEIVPPGGSTLLLQAKHAAIGANPGRLALDYSGSTNPPADGTIDGTIVIGVSMTMLSSNSVLDITVGLNGAIVSADLRGTIGGGGQQVQGVTFPILLSVSLLDLSDGDEFSIFARGDSGAWSVEAFSVQYVGQSVGTSEGGGGGTSDHRLLTFRSATGSHPATAVSFQAAGGIAAVNVQAAIEEVDTEKADKTVGATDGTLPKLVGNNLAQSSLDETEVQGHIDDGTIHYTQAAIDHTAIQNVGTNTHAQIDAALAGLPATFVSTFEGRSGAVTGQAGDYTAGEVGAAPAAHVGAGGAPATHALAVAGGAAGFMSGADKTAVDNIPANFVSTFEGRDGAVVAQAGDYTAAEVGAIPAVGTADGDLFSFDGTSYTKIAIGADGRALIARPGNSVGLKLVWEDTVGTDAVTSASPTVDGEVQLGDATSKGIKGAGYQGTVVARTDQANSFAGGNVFQSPITVEAAAIPFHYLGTPAGTHSAWLYSSGVTVLASTDLAGQIDAQAIRMLQNGNVSIGDTQVSPTGSKGDLQAAGSIVGEGGLFEWINSNPIQVLSPQRSDTIGQGTGYPVAGTAIAAGTTLELKPSEGQNRYATGTGVVTVSAPTEEGPVVVLAPSTVTFAVNAAYTATNTAPTGREYEAIFRMSGTIALVTYA